MFIQEISQVPTSECGPQTSPTTCNFLSKLNNSSGNIYSAVVSERVGSLHHFIDLLGDGNPEQYMIVYQTSKVEVLESFIYNDTSNRFVRPPHIVKLRSSLFS